ncbi:MAG: AAA family ATPase [Candidatus Colwellbacteria bacterium]|nr:AAA family ATPase [Candidatus Colwellbacteria bacterium]
MFLQRLELQGFKSFAGKTVLDFPGGVSAIVGPNGSGKSNVTDAIRWLLGEREAKNLRGAKADDLIFAGTEKRSRMGIAQASIYFDNSSGFFPTEYKEVVITRRIDRDGNSAFYLNQAEMRLKDIIDFFARARLGARGLNIISQGESDAFLRATPAERRELIEEALGLKEYLLKKNSAVRELRNTGVNLDKARAMLEEIKPHLRTLRRQVGRYEERDNLALELKETEELFYGSKVRAIISDLSRFDPEISATDSDIVIKKEELSALEASFKGIESSEPKAKKDLESIRERRKVLFGERMALVPRPVLIPSPFIEHKAKKDPLAILREIRGFAESALDSSDSETLKAVLKRIISAIIDLESVPVVHSAPIVKKDDVFESKVAEFDRLFEELDVAEKKLTTELEGFNKVFRDSLTAVERKKDDIQALIDRRERVVFEREKIKYREEEIENQLRVIGRSFAEFANASDVSADFDSFTAERRIFKLRNELAAIGDVDESIVKEAKDTGERHDILVTQIDELEKATSDLKELIKELDYKIHHEFTVALDKINGELADFAKLMFGGGRVALKLQSPVISIEAEGVILPEGEASEENIRQGIEIEVVLPKKRVKGLEVLSGGERSLLAVAILFGLISISPPPFIVLDEVDAALDERNARRLGEILKRFEGKTQFIIVTHNRATMESADVLYGVTMGDDGSSKIVSLKLS